MDKFDSIWKKQQTGLVKKTSPLNAVLGGVWVKLSDNFTGTEQQCGGKGQPFWNLVGMGVEGVNDGFGGCYREFWIFE